MTENTNYRVLENSSMIHETELSDLYEALILAKNAHKKNPNKYHEVYKRINGEIFGIFQIKPNECLNGIPLESKYRYESCIRCNEICDQRITKIPYADKNGKCPDCHNSPILYDTWKIERQTELNYQLTSQFFIIALCVHCNKPFKILTEKCTIADQEFCKLCNEDCNLKGDTKNDCIYSKYICPDCDHDKCELRLTDFTNKGD